MGGLRKIGIVLLAVVILGTGIASAGEGVAAEGGAKNGAKDGVKDGAKDGAKLRVAATPAASRAIELALGSHETVLKMLNGGVRARVYAVPVTDTFLTWKTGDSEKTYPVDRNGVVYDAETSEKVILQEPDRQLLAKRVRELRGSYYGQLLPWDEAKTHIPKMSKFALTDLETGMTFYAQRRAGSAHADVQPLTREDTEIMKRIYGGKWSWKRRAILIRTDDSVLAASMHGKPHGGDGIPDNGFSGHFCVHFLGSLTHKSRNVDPEHQLMVFKAAGKLPEYVGSMDPDKIVATFFKTFNLKEIPTARMLFEAPYNDKLERLLANVDNISSERVKEKASDVTEDDLVADLSRNVSMHFASNRALKLKLKLSLVRESPAEPWKIESIAATDGKGRDLLEQP